MYTTFDPRIVVNNVDTFKGEFTKVALIQDPGPGHVSNLAIDCTKDAFIDLEWRVTGQDVAIRMNGIELDANGDRWWNIYAYAESIGPGNEFKLGEEKEKVGTLQANIMNWTHRFKIPANTMPGHEQPPAAASGLFTIGIVVWANSNVPGSNNDVIGFAEVPCILSAAQS